MANSRLVLALAGVAISVYSIYVDKKFQEDENATAMCDIGEFLRFRAKYYCILASWSTCKGAFQSEYGTGFGIVCKITGEDHVLCQKNSVYGLFFYGLMVPLTLMRNTAAAEGWVSKAAPKTLQCPHTQGKIVPFSRSLSEFSKTTPGQTLIPDND